jgi:monoamine oxidase
VVLLGSAVALVEWQEGQAAVTTVAGARYEARRVVVALPLGVLQGGSVRFAPEPGETMAAARLLASGAVQRIVLRFRDRFWAERAEGMRFLFTEGETPRTWWTTEPRKSPLLIGWMGGPRALAVGSTEELVASGLRSLERIFSLAAGRLERELVSWHAHDWQADPWSLGAYSYAPKGAADAAERMTEPLAGTLFFAGEHTDTTGHPGTVHGALRSGLRAATQVLAAMATAG